MSRKSKNPGSKKHKVDPPKDEALVAEAAQVQGRVIERADGFYWEGKQKDEAHGPFATLAEAEADMLSGGTTAEELEPPEALQEAESELGINEWIDPDTGGPAEDNIPRIEDH